VIRFVDLVTYNQRIVRGAGSCFQLVFGGAAGRFVDGVDANYHHHVVWELSTYYVSNYVLVRGEHP
jgi:hypothetical protein